MWETPDGKTIFEVIRISTTISRRHEVTDEEKTERVDETEVEA